MNERIVERLLDYKEPTNNFYKELEIYRDYDGNEEGSIVNRFKFHTIFGKVMFKKMLGEMTTDMDLIKFRQEKMGQLGHSKIGTIHRPMLGKINELTDDLLWFHKNHSDETIEYLSSAYFTNGWLTWLNHPVPLQALSWYKIYTSPLINVIIPIITMIGTYIAFRVMGFKIDISTFFRLIMIFLPQLADSKFGPIGKYGPLALWLFFYLSNLYNTIKASLDHYKLCNDIYSKVANYNQAVKLMQSTARNRIQPKIDVYTPSTYCCGTSISGFLDLKNRTYIDSLLQLMKEVGELDVYLTLGDMYGYDGPLLTNFKEAKKPFIEVKDLWHPYLDYKKAVKNDITIGKGKGIIITGPNANGKSMTIKALGISILFSQTFGIGFGKVTMTPFTMMETYMNIPDCKGKESLFEAEMHRCKEYFDHVKGLKKGEFSVIIVDEIFTGTNAKESISGAFAVCKKLGRTKGVLPIITTHYNHLTKLKKYYTNYKMPVDIEIENNGKKKIKYTYKLVEGVSDQFIAIDLLEQKGFDSDIVNCARKIASGLLEI